MYITRVSPNAYVHTTYLQTQDFGHVPCNGLVLCSSREALVFDTPTDDKNSERLLKWIEDSLHAKTKAVVPTHFHNDCLGGLNAFHRAGIASYAYHKTIELAKTNGFAVPQNAFTDSLTLAVGNETVIIKFFGEGHTRDNVVAYFPSENVLFGGCLVKELRAGKGYLGDANVAAWSATVKSVKKRFPDVNVVVPGHGSCGNAKLLDYTIRLFRP